MTCEFESWIGAYVLDALEPDETAIVQSHLAGCPQCQDDMIGLSWIPEVLRRARLEDVDLPAREGSTGSAALPSHVMLDRLLASARVERRARKRRRWSVTIATAALVTAGAAAIALATASGPAHSVVIRTVDPTTHVEAAVTVTPRSWGSEVELELTGAYPDGHCSLLARATDGRTDIAASWVASNQGGANVPAATAIRAGQLAEFDVITSSGRQLARIVVPHQNN